MVDQAEIHRKVTSGDVGERREGIEQLRSYFSDLPDKDAAWKDLHRLIEDEDSLVRWRAANTLGFAFQHFPDKTQAWNDLHLLIKDKDSYVRSHAAVALGSAFQHVPYKDVAWEDLHLLTGDKNRYVRRSTAIALDSAFLHIPDKKLVFEDLIQLSGDEDYVRVYAIHSLRAIIFKATETESEELRKEIKNAMEFLDNKPRPRPPGPELTKGTSWREPEERVRQLRNDFANHSNKEQAYENLHGFALNESWLVRRNAVGALGSVFDHIPDKNHAWKFLCMRLVLDKAESVQRIIAEVLVAVFPQIPDEKQAWSDLHGLITYDEGIVVRRLMMGILSTIFPQIPNKKQAWEDLHWLTKSEDRTVQRLAAYALGSNFPQIPDKKQAWEDLQELAMDKNRYVRTYANHSLGRASIFNATETENEEDFKKEIKKSLEFFERSSKEATSLRNPSSFCLPFYSSFYTVTFEKEKAKDEVQRYLSEAKIASKGSENKEMLLEAIENLASALTEAQKVTDFDDTKSDLKACMKYCNNAANLIGAAAEDAPGAAGILRRGIPIIGEQIRDIQENAEALCMETRGTGTPYEPLGMEVNKWARDLSDRGYLWDEKDVPRIRDLLGKLCNLISEDERDYPCKIIEEISEEREPEDNLSDVVTALSYLVPNIKIQIQNLAKPTTDRTRSDEQPLQKTGHITKVNAEPGSTVVVTQTEKESGDVTVNTAVTKESHPEEHRIDHQKRTAIEISADIAVHVLVYTVLHHFVEDLMSIIAPILVITALITLILIIRNAKSG
ncbi:MAG: hypothetical protein C5S48_00130 [Candidatus Methanogaster sp.]|nr:MAG: hypothetical protein C5S48_00130 [ANME-2 cluster archaeon]